MAESASSVAPDEQTIADAANLKIWDIKGKQVRFGDIFESEKAVIVFISEQSQYSPRTSDEIWFFFQDTSSVG